MANYQITLRTNDFHVKDEELFLEFMSRVIVDGDELELLMNTDRNGDPLYGFATHGLIVGISGTDDETVDDQTTDTYGEFIVGLQEIVESDDAIIILEIGNSKLSDVYATATIITESETDYVDLREVASDKAVDLLCGTFGT